MLDFSNSKLNFVAGIALVCAFVVLYLLITIPISNTSRYIYNVHFRNVKNLHKGQVVYLNGYPVGFVSSTFLYKDDAVAKVAISNSIPIPIDSSFNIVTSNLISDSKLLLLNLGVEEENFVAGADIYNTTLSLSLDTILNMVASYINGKQSNSKNKEPKANE